MNRFLIVGGGIGGLTAALALRRAGAAVTVVEREATFSPIGAGVVLAPNAIAILDQLGVGTAERGERVGTILLTTARGRELQRLDLRAWRDLGPAYAFHRAELHQALLEAMPRDVVVRCGVTFDALDEGDAGVEVRLSDGSEQRFDVIVGADGIRSSVRSRTDPGVGLRYSGYTCWRTVCPNPGIVGSMEVWGRGSRLGAVPLSRGRLYVFLVKNAPPRAPDLDWEGLRQVFGEFSDPCSAILASMRGAALLHHDLEELDTPAWGRGRLWLLGDAAHASTPNLGQGAAMAIEDACVLARCLDRNPATAHGRYVAARHQRVRRLQIESRRLGRIAHWESAPAVWARDTVVRLLPRALSDRQYLQVVEPGLALARAAAQGVSSSFS